MVTQSLGNFATRDLVVVSWDDSLENAYMMMARHEVRHLPVVHSGKIVGLISDRDLQRAMLVAKPDFLVDKVSLPEFDQDAQVRDYMGWPIEAIDESHSVRDAAREMINKKISALIVTRGSEVSGIVTTEDLLRFIVNETESKNGAMREIKDQLEGALYNSPVGQIAQLLANVGV